MESRHVKSINTDSRSKKKIKFASAKERAKRASADVYRSHKRKLGATSSATREEAVHNPHREFGSRKRQRSNHLVAVGSDDGTKAAVVKVGDRKDIETEASVQLSIEHAAHSSFAEELDETLDRNASEVFGKFHRKVWPLVRSLPEILHHAESIVDLMLLHIVSPESSPEVPTDPDALKDPSKAPRGYVVNHGTIDILHLMAVLARDLRHEIHPYLQIILRRIIYDLLNPPPPPPESGKQPIPLDVTLVEAAFRCLSYIFRYDADKILEDLEGMRKYYGATLAARRELVRRLAAETFAPLIRKLKSSSERHRHLKRVLKALVVATSGESSSSTALQERTKGDAVDGISQLIFQVVRGVPGRLHSQGLSTIRYVFIYCCNANSESQEEDPSVSLLVSLASSVVEILFRHFYGSVSDQTSAMLVNVLKETLSESARSKSGMAPAINALRLLARASTLRLTSSSELQLKDGVSLLFESMDLMFSKGCLASLSSRKLEEALVLACPIWIEFQESQGSELRLQRWLQAIFKLHESIDDVKADPTSFQRLASTLSQDLLPHLTNKGCSRVARSTALSAAARLANFDRGSTLLILFAISSKYEERGRFVGKSSDSDSEVAFKVSDEGSQLLFKACHMAFQGKSYKDEYIEQLLVAIRCVPFVTRLRSENLASSERAELFHLSTSYLADVIVAAGKVSFSKRGRMTDGTRLVIQGMCLEGLSHLAYDFVSSSKDEEVVRKSFQRVVGIANRLLFKHASSLWIVRGLAAFVGLLSKIGLVLNDKLDDTFDALVKNLSHSSHKLRLHSLEILATYPAKNYVTDHADLDLEGDLDEEPSHRREDGNEKSTSRGPVGTCDLIDLLLRIESFQIQLTKERPLMGMVARVEVLGRSGKLPVVYAEAAANHMLGLFYIKFSPLWPAVEKALVALARGQENVAWPPLQTTLVATMKMQSMEDETSASVQHVSIPTSFEDYHSSCLLWQKSEGRIISAFGEESIVEDGRIHRHLTTDKATLMESIWRVAEKCQQLVAKHSRVVVPCFVEFLSNQYFLYHFDDPSARELDLKPADPKNTSAVREVLRKYDLQKKLICFLRVFAAIDGPQQLVQHGLLEKIFRSFLTHQETIVVQLSLAALFKFKPSYLIPYRELLTDMLQKGKLRNALLSFQEALETGKVADEHRELLIPFVSRLVFGRLSIRESRSGKDSPAARRASILSFVSLLCKDDNELFPFIYLMVRSFIPRTFVGLREVESYSENERSAVLKSVNSIDDKNLQLPSSVIEGFLHLLQPVVAQLGHRIKTLIPMISSILLALCRLVAVVAAGDEKIETPTTDDSSPVETHESLRRGAIRTLCYQTISEILTVYANVIDFEDFGVALWDAIGTSVSLLPEMVVKAEKPPALLHLFYAMASEKQLIGLLFVYEPAIEAIIKCIAKTTLVGSMNVVLSILEWLLEEAISSQSKKTRRPLFVAHVPLLMEHFTDRLKGADSTAQISSVTTPARKTRIKLREATWRKELSILCQVSELLDSKEDFADSNSKTLVRDLAALLLPFLEPGQGTSDEDKLNVLGILKRIICQVDHAGLRAVFDTISTVLGPNKGKPGIESITVRKDVADLFEIITTRMPELSHIASKISRMSALNSKRVDEVDFETIIPELNSLNREDSNCDWQRLGSKDPLQLAPIINLCFHYLYNDDGVLARASFNALKTAVIVSSKEARRNPGFIKVVESLIVPPSRAGLQARSATIRRFYVLLIREIAVNFCDHDSPNLCGDLAVFIDEDNPDLDFFVGITHVQLHRRARAFQRLRRILNEDKKVSSSLSSQSLSSVLLPLAMHPAYESKMKVEESFALEGIATVGAIARLLPWNKYHNTIQSILSSFDRHPEQERYLVSTLCAIIDSFGFELVATSPPAAMEGTATSKEEHRTAVWGALERRIIPKLETLLLKEKVEKSGSKVKLIRPPVVLALTKLFLKFPEDFFESKLPRILTVMCDALRSKDSDARDLARTTMAKIVTGINLKYLSDVIRELTITLNEGYKLHVRSATMHTILQELQASYTPPSSDMLKTASSPTFDSSIPAMMDILQEDLFGEANERREAQETNVRYVKEAGGTKSVHSIELMCRMIRFEPSLAGKGGISKSSTHCIVSPLLERLRASDVKVSTIRKIKEIMVRVVVGLSHNPSVGYKELFPFVHATIQPFIGSQLISSVYDDDDDDDETEDTLKISGSLRGTKSKGAKSKKSGKVSDWRPSTFSTPLSSKAAIDLQRKERNQLRTVVDGASAPKLTGSARHGSLDANDIQSLNDPATISAVVFGLNLLHSSLKKLNLKQADQTELIAMMDPFVPMLTACICNCKDNDVALVAMKCLMTFLRFHLPSLDECSKSLGAQALTFLSSSGSSLNQSNDMTQACFRTLTYLINRDRDSMADQGSGKEEFLISGAQGEQVLAGNATLPLNGEQMKVLIAFLSVSITESDQHNPALGLIKAIMSRKFMSPEFYDLMDSMLKINVRSQKASLRQQSGGIFIRYLIDYPMSEDRFEAHLKQIVANISYAHKEGRLSAIQMLSSVIEKIPNALLQQHAQLIFLPQVLQLVNDDTKECREAVSKCLTILLRRCSKEVLNSFHNYAVRWCGGEGPMQVASLQVFAIFVDSSPSFVKNHTPAWISRLVSLLDESSREWEATYFALICLEKLAKIDLSLFQQSKELWPFVVGRLIDPHPWVKLASCRLVQKLFDSDKPKTLEQCPGMLFDIVRNICFQINVDEDEYSEELATKAIKTLTLALQLLSERPELCFTADSPHAGLRDPVAWLLRRLSGIAKPKGRQRRMTVYKCFAAFCTIHGGLLLQKEDKKQRRLYLELMLEPVHRSHLEATNEIDNPSVIHKAAAVEEEMTESTLARDVLQMIEEGCDPEDFLAAYAAVKTRARDKKEQRKSQAKAEAIQDPAAAVIRKSKKHEQERDRKKRRVEERRRDRGAMKKRRSYT